MGLVQNVTCVWLTLALPRFTAQKAAKERKLLVQSEKAAKTTVE